MSRGRKAFLYLLYAVIVVALVVSIVDASKSHTATPVPKIPAKAQQATAPPKKPSTSNTSKSTGLSAGQAASATANSTGLSDTGPGNVVGLFVVVSLGGAVAYRQLIIRRLSA
jgi:hypothetical protein